MSTTTLGTWSGRDVRASDVLAALSDLRRAEQRAAVRTSVLTLIGVAADRAGADAMLEVVRAMGEHHPSRAVLLVPGEGDAGIDAEVGVHVVERSGVAVCFEDAVLEVRGGVIRHLDSLIEPFTLPDLPVAVWLPSRLPSIDDPLFRAADRVIVDGRALGDLAAFGELARLVRKLPVTDLSWVRLAPWRALLAGLFDAPDMRPFLDEVTSVTVSGRAGPRHLLAGWLATRLRLPPELLHFEEATHVSIDVRARHDGHEGRFAIVRHGDERVIEALIEISDGPRPARSVPLPKRSSAATLARALATTGHDRPYEQAVAWSPVSSR